MSQHEMGRKHFPPLRTTYNQCCLLPLYDQNWHILYSPQAVAVFPNASEMFYLLHYGYKWSTNASAEYCFKKFSRFLIGIRVARHLFFEKENMAVVSKVVENHKF